MIRRRDHTRDIIVSNRSLGRIDDEPGELCQLVGGDVENLQGRQMPDFRRQTLQSIVVEIQYFQLSKLPNLLWNSGKTVAVTTEMLQVLQFAEPCRERHDAVAI